MSASLDGKLVVAISSRALFDFEEENEVFEQGDDRAYMALQLQRLEIPAKPGVAFSLVKKLLAFNQGQPSPQPSPKGRGSERLDAGVLPPLPLGEGWGEGCPWLKASNFFTSENATPGLAGVSSRSSCSAM